MDKVMKFLLTTVVNWQTTLGGVLTLVNSLGEFLIKLATAVSALLDGDMSTIADFGSVKSSFALVVLGVSLIFAKDGNKSTEDVKKVQG